MINRTFIKKYILSRLLSRSRSVPISQCVHYCAFKYGSNQYNPYETYIIELHNGKPEKEVKEKFITFLRYYRPVFFADALGLKLSRNYPLWQYPWSQKIDSSYNAFNMVPSRIPDIITHFSEEGIPFEMIKTEFDALKSAYDSISKRGYQPKKFGYAEITCLKNGEHEAYLLLDGNHRISALSALGYKTVAVKHYIKDVIERQDVKMWPGVKSCFYTEADALKIFDVYFSGNHSYKTTTAPAKIIY